MSARINLNRKRIASKLADPDTSGLVLLTIVLFEFGDAVFGSDDVDQMDSAEMWADLHEIYNTWVIEENENRLNAMITGLTGGSFWQDVEVFSAVCETLIDGDLGDDVGFMFDNLSAVEIMWGMLEMSVALDGEEPPTLSMDVAELIDRVFTAEQEDQAENELMVEKEFQDMLQGMQEIGIPPAFIREIDESYEDLMSSVTDDEI